MGEQNKSIEFARIISKEHADKNKGCPYPIKQLIKNLRNRRGVSENWISFSSTMEEIAAQDLSIFNLKWMKSICDTYVDHDEGKRGLMAMSISTFLNTLKLGESSRRLHLSNPIRLKPYSRKNRNLYDGYCLLSLKDQDACLTASRRMTWILRSDPLMKAIWEEILARVHTHSELIKELKNSSNYPQRYFPIDPTGIEDAYHLTYEQLYK